MDYTKRQYKEIKKGMMRKWKELRAALKTAGKQAFKVAKSGWTVCNNDPFITLVVGQYNFKEDNPCEKYRNCGNAIRLCLSVNQAARKKHVEKRKLGMKICRNGGLGFTLIRNAMWVNQAQ